MLDLLRAAFSPREILKTMAPASVVRALGPVSWTKQDTDGYIREGYQRCSIVYRCVDIVAQHFSRVPMRVRVNGKGTKKGKEQPDHPLAKLLARPNPFQSGTDFLQSLVNWRLITGQSYLERMRGIGDTGPVLELWSIPARMVQVVKPRSAVREHPLGFIARSPQGTMELGWKVDPVSGQCDLMNWHTFNPLDGAFGQSPLMAGMYPVDQHNAAGQWNAQMMVNRAEPSMVLSTAQQLNEAQFKRMEAAIKEKFSGATNARKAMILEGGVKPERIGLTPVEMDWLNGENAKALQICGIYGVPSQMVPIPGSQTFANFKEARLSLTQDTVLPLLDNFLTSFNAWMQADYPGVEVFYRRQDVEALADVIMEEMTTLDGVQFLTANEKRERVDLEPYANPLADTLYLSATAIPMDDPKADAEAQAAADGLAAAGGTTVADTGLNGAQIDSMLSIVEQVIAGQLPPESAAAALRIAFPEMGDEDIAALLDPLVGFKPEPVEDPAAPGDDEETPPEDPAKVKAKKTPAEQEAEVDSAKVRVRETLAKMRGTDIAQVAKAVAALAATMKGRE